jgi:hypothetical protein
VRAGSGITVRAGHIPPMKSITPQQPMSSSRDRAATVAVLLATAALTTFSLISTGRAEGGKKMVDYNRDIRPILSAKCFACHGADPKAIQAGLRLDRRADALRKLASGRQAIVPGDILASELTQRISTSGPMVMPPVDSHKALTTAEKQTLMRWIGEGAEYKEHWAFVKQVRPALPAVKQKAWPKNGIDYFVLAKLEKEHLAPASEADRTTLIRRASLDLTGVPPMPAEVDAFLADKSPNAYEKVVDRLLASPRYGERMAMTWLDGARYADSNGYQADYERFQWRWRDWVIDSFNHNMPFDQFTVEQIAGDLLPNATVSQKLATGFNRNHRINTEGGVIPEEWRVETVIDRVETTSSVWLGMTTGCARCHDHKYDPVSQKDFYSLYAYFNNVPESGSGAESPVNHPPFIKTPTMNQEKQLAAANARIATLDAQIAEKEKTGAASIEADATKALAAADTQLATGMTAHLTFNTAPANAVVTGKPEFQTAAYVSGMAKLDGASYCDLTAPGDFDKGQSFSYGCWINPENGSGVPLSRMDAGADFRGWDMFLAGGRPIVHIINKWPMNALKVSAKETIPNRQWSHVFVTYDGSAKPAGVKIYINGRLVEHTTDNDNLTETIRTAKPLRIGGRYGADGFRGMVDDVRLYVRMVPAEEVALLAQTDPLRPALATSPDKRTDTQRQTLARYALRASDPAYRQMSDDRTKAMVQRDSIDQMVPTTMVMEEMPKPRECFVLVRGEYDKRGETVTAAIPSALGALPAGAPNNRLGLARWIASPNNPLTARVAVNRMWEKFFGVGIVATSEDFGVRAEFPSHPELLDWLATEFVRRKWDMKAMQKLMVMSAAYRQSSVAPPALWKRDPENRLLARGPRFRLPAEVIRDQALAVSGLLVEKTGGPSVRPYQPDGVWDELSVYGNLRNYKHDKGEGLYRRSLYTIWKRTSAPPLMSLFDVAGRDTCRVRRYRTNTPLQALALLNDETFIEASRVLAQKMLTEGGSTPESRIAYAFRRTLGRRPTPVESKVLADGLRKRLVRYRATPEVAEKLLAIGDTPRDKQLNAPELAAYTLTASVLLNLDETVTKE